MPPTKAATQLEPASHHPAFEPVDHREVFSLKLAITEYRHRATGARHFHFTADDSNNAFLVAFLTVPQDSTGVAHILEHTSLCGSDKYPVRDPFFMMLRRSLNTFMNAFTASDWTAYPFATQNRKDFYNLLEVYLDAVFFPRLDPLDFAQEGHRVEFEQPDDPTTPLQFKGVVYNEMKGAMSSPVAQLWQTLQTELFPTTTYHYNSGGDPAAIPDLTHTQLKAFHAHHYHPSNALFMTYGDLPVGDHQRYIEDCALTRFERQEMNLGVPNEQRFGTPRKIASQYALEGEEDLQRKTHVVMSWLLGRGADLEQQLTAHLLSGVLLDNSSSPLRYALETTELGTAPSEICGLDDSTREMVFVCGLEGCEAGSTDRVEKLVLEVLEKVAEEGLPESQTEAILHQLELEQREIKSGGFPYGLRLMVNTLAPALHGGDPARLLDIDPVLEKLRTSVADPEYVKALVREQLLDNPHRLCLSMEPDPDLNRRQEADTRARLDAMRAAMRAEETAATAELAAALETRQTSEDDPELLPKVGLEDVPLDLHIPSGTTTTLDRYRATVFDAATNGMVYEQLIVDLPAVPGELHADLPLLCAALGEVGSGGRDYLQTQALQAAKTGGIGARLSIRSPMTDLDNPSTLFVISGKSLRRHQQALSDLLRDTWAYARLDEQNKLRELISEIRAQREMAVTGQGHALAMTAACATMNPVGALAHAWDGLFGLQQLKALDDSLEDPRTLAGYAHRLDDLYQHLRSVAPSFLLIAENDGGQELADSIIGAWRDWLGQASATSNTALAAKRAYEPVRQAWGTSTRVNFCAKAFPTVAQAHDDAPALTVLGGFLRNGFLHRAIREQGGAYGGGASYDADTGAFKFFSYRDPRLAETLADFEHSVSWLLETRHPERTLEEAILGVIASIDRPGSPAGEAATAYFAALTGRTPERRRAFRQRVLEVSLEDLKRVAEHYLTDDNASTAVISDPATLEAQSGLGLEIRAL